MMMFANRLVAMCLVLGLVAAFGAPLEAGNATRNGNSGSDLMHDWKNAANWVPATVPGAGETATFDLTSDFVQTNFGMDGTGNPDGSDIAANGNGIVLDVTNGEHYFHGYLGTTMYISNWNAAPSVVTGWTSETAFVYAAAIVQGPATGFGSEIYLYDYVVMEFNQGANFAGAVISIGGTSSMKFVGTTSLSGAFLTNNGVIFFENGSVDASSVGNIGGDIIINGTVNWTGSFSPTGNVTINSGAQLIVDGDVDLSGASSFMNNGQLVLASGSATFDQGMIFDVGDIHVAAPSADILFYNGLSTFSELRVSGSGSTILDYNGLDFYVGDFVIQSGTSCTWERDIGAPAILYIEGSNFEIQSGAELVLPSAVTIDTQAMAAGSQNSAGAVRFTSGSPQYIACGPSNPFPKIIVDGGSPELTGSFDLVTQGLIFESNATFDVAGLSVLSEMIEIQSSLLVTITDSLGNGGTPVDIVNGSITGLNIQSSAQLNLQNIDLNLSGCTGSTPVSNGGWIAVVSGFGVGLTPPTAGHNLGNISVQSNSDFFLFGNLSSTGTLELNGNSSIDSSIASAVFSTLSILGNTSVSFTGPALTIQSGVNCGGSFSCATGPGSTIVFEGIVNPTSPLSLSGMGDFIFDSADVTPTNLTLSTTGVVSIVNGQTNWFGDFTGPTGGSISIDSASTLLIRNNCNFNPCSAFQNNGVLWLNTPNSSNRSFSPGGNTFDMGNVRFDGFGPVYIQTDFFSTKTVTCQGVNTTFVAGLDGIYFECDHLVGNTGGTRTRFEGNVAPANGFGLIIIYESISGRVEVNAMTGVVMDISTVTTANTCDLHFSSGTDCGFL
ncbi:MAG: hypothetical protein KDB07_10640, partial [Planctomycetes bacterium]|nr:hypothetical protein [Planctomycetota bacterium]